MEVKSPVLCSQFLTQFFYLYILTLCLLLYLCCFSMCLCSVKINHSWIPFPTKSCLFFPITVKSSFSIFEFSGYNCFKIGFLFYMCVCIYVCIYMCVCVCVCVCVLMYMTSILVIWCIHMTHWTSSWCWERWRTEERGASEDEMVGWHHQCNEHELGQTPGDGERHRGLVCCRP